MVLSSLLILGPLVAAVLLWPVAHRWPRVADAGGSFIALSLGLILSVGATGEESVALFGSAIPWEEGAATILVALLAATGLLFLFSAIWSPGGLFAPTAMAALSPLAVALLMPPFPIGAFALLAATVLAALTLTSGQPEAALPALRYLTAGVFAFPLILLAGWIATSGQPLFTASIWRLLLPGAALLLGAVPFQFWVRPAVASASLPAIVFIFVQVQLVVALSLTRLIELPLVEQNELFITALSWLGAATALVGGLLAVTERDGPALIGSLLLADIGVSIVGLSLVEADLSPLLTVLLVRFISLLLLAPDLMQRRAQPSSVAGWRQWRVMLLLYGAFSLAGFPLTPGFAGRWLVVQLAAGASFWLSLALLLATLAGIVALLRLLASHPRLAHEHLSG
ncbi:MAG: proton-conducting transporter membrane subunit [Candidatus Promineifilaceae bacterium]|nr:proton-conducting transporter membrane subunit [Candidatus Promineifilaceae bacterium]